MECAVLAGHDGNVQIVYSSLLGMCFLPVCQHLHLKCSFLLGRWVSFVLCTMQTKKKKDTHCVSGVLCG